MSALLTAKPVSRAPECQVERRNLETRTQVGKFFQCSQTASCNGSQLDLGGQQEIRVSPAIRSAHAAAQLIQFGEPQTIGTVDQDGVAQRDVEAVLNDGC